MSCSGRLVVQVAVLKSEMCFASLIWEVLCYAVLFGGVYVCVDVLCFAVWDLNDCFLCCGAVGRL